jgi:diguanylate cyclase (GGDEF)-like protein
MSTLAFTSGLLLTGVTLASAMYWRERQRRLLLVAELAAMTMQMNGHLHHDALTGLFSRAGLEVELDQTIAQADANGNSFCVLYVALDNFGILNDAFGQISGDSLLRNVAKRLTQCAQQPAKVCRLSAAEFAMIVPGGMRAGCRVAAQVTKSLAEPVRVDVTQTVLSCSVGLAEYPEHGSRAKILENAALAMRSVKATGGGGFCEYDPKMRMEVRDQAVLVQELRSALEHDQFELYYQPKVDAVTLQVTAAEALLRWHHPTRGIVSPAIFIPLAERHGMIGSIGNWVIEEACKQAASWGERGLHMRVAVNISGYQMREGDLVERIESALLRNRLQPGRFTCEITESVAMEDTKVTMLTFDKMRQAGFHVSIDDFGTGFSSLSALRRLPAAELKIDRAFVIDLEESEDARLIAQSIINLATSLSLRVVAEGVETVGQCNLLVQMGCNELQGFLFSKPIPAKDLEWLALDSHRLEDVAFRPSLFEETASPLSQ